MKTGVLALFAVLPSALFLAGCASSNSDKTPLSPSRFQAMALCVDRSVSRAINEGNTGAHSYSGILSRCSAEYSALAVARYADGLPPVPYGFWQLRVLRTLEVARKESGASERERLREIEKDFLTAYHALTGNVVIVNTALQKCSKELTTTAKSVVLKKTISEIQDIILSSQEFIRHWDQRFKGELKVLLDDFSRVASTEFLKTVDELFARNKLASSCPRALNMEITAKYLDDYLVNLLRLDREDLGTDAKTALQKIRLKAFSVLSSLRNA